MMASRDIEMCKLDLVKKALCSNSASVMYDVKQWLESIKGHQPGMVNAHLADDDKTALHMAAQHNNVQVANLLLNANADPSLPDEENRTALHIACALPQGEDVTDLVAALLHTVEDTDGNIPVQHVAAPAGHARTSLIGAQDRSENTPLHYAAKKGHLEAVKLLLVKSTEEDMKQEDKDGNYPVHVAASAGHARIVKEMMSKYPQCVNYRSHIKRVPLHLAADGGHFRVVQTILNDHDPSVELDVNAKDDNGDTPLCLVGFCGSIQIAKLLVEKGADVNPDPPVRVHEPPFVYVHQGAEVNPDNKDKPYRGPFHRAGYYGQTELALYLLKKEAKVSGLAFHEIVSEGYDDIAAAVVKSSQWAVALRYTDPIHKTTPLRLLIKEMPAVAEAVLNKCAVEAPKNLIPSHGDPDYSVVYNYEFLEDFRYETETGPGNMQIEPPVLPEEKTGMEKLKAKESDGCGFNDILDRPRKGNWSFDWGPEGFRKSNHPLAIMVRKKRLNLLSHPVVGSLLHHKWNTFGLPAYLLNLLVYVVFLSFLTAFALEVPNPQADICQSNAMNMTGSSSVTCGEMSNSRRIFLYIAPAVVILLSLLLLGVEVAQLVMAIRSQLMISIESYLTDWVNWVNWMEFTLFICSIIFVWVYNTECQCALNWQWQIGVVAVFLGWINLIIFISKFPLAGIYVLMFVKILYTFLKMLILTVLLVIAFGLTFYMLFFDPTANRSPFSDPSRSLLKTMTMTTGDLGFDSIFRLDPTGQSDSLSEIEFLPVSVILWIVFIVFMPILLTNMLTGLAVDDIKTIQREAHLLKLALQVDQVLTIEELLPNQLRRRCRRTYKEVHPNRKEKTRKLVKTKIDFTIWGGDNYETRDGIERALPSSKTDTLVEDVNEIKATLKKTDSLVEEVNEMKATLKGLKYLVEEIAKKNNIEVPHPERAAK